MPTAKNWSWEDIVVKSTCKLNICHPNPESPFWKDRRGWLQTKLPASFFQSSLKVKGHWKHFGLLVRPEWQMLVKLPVTTWGIEIKGRFPKWCHLLPWHGMCQGQGGALGPQCWHQDWVEEQQLPWTHLPSRFRMQSRTGGAALFRKLQLFLWRHSHFLPNSETSQHKSPTATRRKP